MLSTETGAEPQFGEWKVKKKHLFIGFAIGTLALAGCTNDQNINAGTGALAGAAVGSQIGGGSGRTTAILAGAAAGAAIGGNQPTTTTCTVRDPVTGQMRTGPC